MSLKTSVILSLYNPNENFLAQQLESISAQTLKPAELVVYNDNPLDESREKFVLRHVQNIPVRYVHATGNLGYTKAFEKLVLLAEGDLIALCDQDDIWEPDRIASATRAFESNGDVTLVTCDRSVINEEGGWFARAAEPPIPRRKTRGTRATTSPYMPLRPAMP